MPESQDQKNQSNDDPNLWYVLSPGCLFIFVIVTVILLMLGGCAWLETAKRPPHPSHHITKAGWR